MASSSLSLVTATNLNAYTGYTAEGCPNKSAGQQNTHACSIDESLPASGQPQIRGGKSVGITPSYHRNTETVWKGQQVLLWQVTKEAPDKALV